jgi:hypothetical protein
MGDSKTFRMMLNGKSFASRSVFNFTPRGQIPRGEVGHQG